MTITGLSTRSEKIVAAMSDRRNTVVAGLCCIEQGNYVLVKKDIHTQMTLFIGALNQDGRPKLLIC